MSWEDDCGLVKTSYAVWASLRGEHIDELVVFGSYSAPHGDEFGNSSVGKMMTIWGFNNAEEPLIRLETTWDIDRENPSNRLNEKHEAWLYYKKENAND